MNTAHTKKLYLMLDFDGVLHHRDAASRELKPRDIASLDIMTEDERRFIDNEGRLIVGKNLFCHADRMARTLRPFPDVKIVISSTWRNHFDLDRLKGFLPSLADRIIGDLPPVFSRDRAFLRSREIAAYFKLCDSVDWLALDDTANLFFDYAQNPNLFLVDGERGFDDVAALSLAARLKDFFAKLN